MLHGHTPQIIVIDDADALTKDEPERISEERKREEELRHMRAAQEAAVPLNRKARRAREAQEHQRMRALRREARKLGLQLEDVLGVDNT